MSGTEARRITSAKTGSASAQSGGVAVSGVVNGNVFVGAPARSRYEEQVRRIAPPELFDRQEELAELAAFCTAPDVPSRYVWWRAEAWAGKSALMSWFVLNPPTAVRIVSFFITARLASQDDRVAFTDNVLEQLAALTGEPIPAYLTATNREAHLLGLLRDAAYLCHERGERLVLLVDGLDEDTGPDSYSVAALLPVQPAADMRVIVSGRPDPPIPGDVPDHHPLRDPAVVRPLRASAAATAVRADMERDLARILAGTETDQDLLGLVVTAAGGLSGSDLAELTNCPPRHVERKLNTVAGRSFASRPSYWPSVHERATYVMGHEELQRTALMELGEERLAAYRERLHLWADGYRRRDWPESTPEYLLRGYHRMLASTQDTDRMIVSATDATLHDRLLDRSGSDAQALKDIVATQRAIVDSAEPDLAALARVTMHRDRLYDRNTNIPAHLPALWATLGHFERAEKLALLAQEMDTTTDTLANLMQVLVSSQHVDRAERLIQALGEQPDVLAEAGVDLFKIMARFGHIEPCRRFARSVVGAKEQVSALTALTWAEAVCGNTREARLIVEDIRTRAPSLPEPEDREWAAGRLVEALAAVAEYDEAEVVARSITHWSYAPRAMAALMESLAFARQTERADAMRPLVNEVAALGDAMAGLVKAATDAGDFSRAETLCRDSGDTYRLSKARLNLVRAYAHRNNFDRAEQIGPTIGNTNLRAEAYGALVRSIAESGDTERAEALVETFSVLRPAALTGLAWGMAATGRLDYALDLAHEAQQATHSVVDSHTKDRTACELIEAITAANGHSVSAEAEIAVWIEPDRLDDVGGARVRGLIRFGDLGQAEHHARTITDVEDRSRHLIRIAEAAIAAHDRDLAQRLAEDIRLLLPSLPGTYWCAEFGAALANIYAWLGDGAQVVQSVADAEGLAESIEFPNQRASVLGSLANAMLVAGDLRRAEELMRAMSDRFATEHAARVLVETAVKAGEDVEAVTAIARSLVDPEQYDWLIWAHVRGLVHVGDLDQAERLADTIQSPDARAHALTDVAAGGETDRARRLTSTIVNLTPTAAYAHERCWLLLRLATAVEPAPALRLIATAYPPLRWNGPLETIAQVCPPVLPAIVKEFVALQQRQRPT